MATSRHQSRRRWISRKRSLRRRWPLYLMLLLLCITGMAILLLMLTQFDAPMRHARAAPRSSAPVSVATR
jgi:hypothetical protein